MSHNKLALIRLGIIVVFCTISFYYVTKLENSSHESHTAFPVESEAVEYEPSPDLEYADLTIRMKIPKPVCEDAKNKEGMEALDKLSLEFQTILAKVVSPPSCKNIHKALLCGGSVVDAGFSVQIQHRMGCLMMAYAMNLPLIHDENTHWHYDEPWTEYLKPFGWDCSLDQVYELLYYDWPEQKMYKLRGENFKRDARTIEGVPKHRIRWFKFPLKNGIPVPSSIALQVRKHHENPFVWFLGQFNKAVYQLQENALRDIQQSRVLLGMDRAQMEGSTSIGIHSRRTDKINETKEARSVIAVETFMDSIMAHLMKINWNRTQPLKIFIATEDCDVVSEFEKKFPAFESNFVSSCNATLPNAESRLHNLFDVIRDISILVDTDYILGAYNSNVDRLVLELRSWQSPTDPNPERHIKSLFGDFFFDLHWNPVHQQRLILIDDKSRRQIPVDTI